MICSGVAQFIAFGDTGTEFRVFRNIRLPLFGLKDLTNAMAGDQFFDPQQSRGKLTKDDAATELHTNTACAMSAH